MWDKSFLCTPLTCSYMELCVCIWLQMLWKHQLKIPKGLTNSCDVSLGCATSLGTPVAAI